MSEPLGVDIFVGDVAHERLLKPLIDRVAEDESVLVEVRVRVARGGHPRALSELDLYQRSVASGVAPRPDVLVVAIDGNCARPARGANTAAIACPDPHVERWYMADPASFTRIVGRTPRLGVRKCDRDRYKRILRETVTAAGHLALLGGIEFASDLVGAMDLYRAGKNEKSLKHFVDDLVAVLRRLRR
jgi:hypothetical protein